MLNYIDTYSAIYFYHFIYEFCAMFCSW